MLGTAVAQQAASPSSTPAPTAASPSSTPSPSASPAAAHQGFTFQLDARTLIQSWDFFSPKKSAENDYVFGSERIRPRLRYDQDNLHLVLEGQDSQVVSLPEHASLPPPAGNLGIGATTWATIHRPSINSLGLRQGYFQVGRQDGFEFTGGRFEYSSALEVPTHDNKLDALISMRLQSRLIGNSNFSDFARTFDGVRLDGDLPLSSHLSGFLAHPTQGQYDAHFGTEISQVVVSDLAWTIKPQLRFLARRSCSGCITATIATPPFSTIGRPRRVAAWLRKAVSTWTPTAPAPW